MLPYSIKRRGYSVTSVCKGRTLVLYINGFETRRLDDNQHVLRKGQVGVSVSSFALLPVEVEFDSVKISEPYVLRCTESLLLPWRLSSFKMRA